MTPTAAPASSKPRLGLFDTLFDESLERCERMLGHLPENRLEARRMITRELSFDPGAEELQTVARLAHDPVAEGLPRRLGLRALALRIVADRELRDVFDAERLEAPRLGRSAELLPGLLREVTALESAIGQRAGAASDAERDFLLQVGGSLLPAREPLIAAVVLLPPLQLLARTIHEDPGQAFPSLAEHHAALLRGSSEPDRGPGSPGRPCVNAIALQAIMLKDLAAWESARDGAEEPTDKARQRLLERLERDRTAYRVVTERLQQQQDTALLARLNDYSEQLRRVKQDLFHTFLGLASVLKDPAGSVAAPADDPGAADGGEGGEGGDAEALAQLLARCSEGDAEAEARQAVRVTEDELYVNALKGLERPAEPSVESRVVDGADELRRERKRLRLMVAVVALLLSICFALPFVLDFDGAVEPNIDVAELPTRLIPIQSIAVGPMMYVQISRWTWSDLGEAEQVTRVEELGQAARQRGLETVFLTDEEDRDLARWSHSEGVTLYRPGS